MEFFSSPRDWRDGLDSVLDVGDLENFSLINFSVSLLLLLDLINFEEFPFWLIVSEDDSELLSPFS